MDIGSDMFASMNWGGPFMVGFKKIKAGWVMVCEVGLGIGISYYYC